MVSAETLLSYPYWKINFTLHTYAYDKQLAAIIIQNNKHIALFLIRIINPKLNYTATDKELIATVEHLKKAHGNIFGYEINLF